MTRFRDEPDAFGPDPLDSSMGLWRRDPAPRASWWLRQRLALGLAPTPVPGLLLLAGMALGPAGLGLFSPTVLSYLDLVVSSALAALGVLIGLGLDMRRPREWRLLGAASMEAGLTIVLVTGGVLLLARNQPSIGTWSPTLALILGICASASSTVPASDASVHRIATRIGDLDDVFPVVLGGLALALAVEVNAAAATWLALQSLAIALVVAVGAGLLVNQSSSESEGRVFTVGAVLLLGGIAEFLSMSALLTGLIAGTFWGLARASARESIGRDVRHLQHPLVVLLLLIAGARAGFSPGVAAVALVYVLLRTVAKFGGGWMVRRMIGPELPAALGIYLLSPGVIAIAFALNVELVGAGPAGSILTIVVLASIASEVLSVSLAPRERGR